MEITIRHAERRDAAAVHDILTSDHVVRGSMRLPYEPAELTERRMEPSSDVIRLVAVSQKGVVGFAELITHPDNPRHRHASEINMIVVAKDAQNKGVGRQLMEAIIDLADNWLQLIRLDLTVWTDNQHAIKLYEKFGFSIEGTMPKYAFGENGFIDAYKMGRIRMREPS